MERRKFIIGVGSLAAGSAAAMGTGAFTSVSADRDVAVTVSDDTDAYLGLQDSGTANDAYFTTSDGEHSVDFDQIDNDSSTSGDQGGAGVNPNAETVAEGVFQIVNQGTQEVSISLSGGGDVSTQDQSTAISAPSSAGINASLDSDAADAVLGTGESIEVDFAITSSNSNLSGTLTIDANAT